MSKKESCGDVPINDGADFGRLFSSLEGNVSACEEALTQLGEVQLISLILETLYDLSNRVLKPLVGQDILTFDYHPPIEIPVHENIKQAVEDPDYVRALSWVGSYVGQMLSGSQLGLATEEQLIENTVAGIQHYGPVVESMSSIGHTIFQTLEQFDQGSGAVIEGKPINTVRALDISAMGPIFHLVRPRFQRASTMVNVIGLADIDMWRISRLKVALLLAKEARITRDLVQSMLQGVRVEPFFFAD